MSLTLKDDLPTTILIYGASGDLTRRKLVPALFNQYAKDRLQGEIQIVGTSRRPYSHEEFRSILHEGMIGLAGFEAEPERWEGFAKRIWYVPGDLSKLEDERTLLEFVEELEEKPANRLYYLATAPNFFPVIVNALGQFGMAEEDQAWRRLVVEKPFGRDLASAHELNEAIHQVFDEHQVFRIDHYLGKETAQNILYFRFLNSIFEPIWNRNLIDHVQITFAEKVDVGHRGGYYDQAGVLRDMFQNHLLQLLSLVAMEPPSNFDADSVRNEKVKVLRAVRPINLRDTVRAQYEGYCSLEGVAEGSITPTYAAVKLFVDNWRWQGVPFYLRSGKALHEKTSEILIEFKKPPHLMFDLPQEYELTPNLLSLCIQPDEGIHLRFETKVPDTPQETRSVDMDFHYHSSFGEEALPDAYERLLIDALNGDASLFTRSDEIEAAWRIADPVLQGWAKDPNASALTGYEPGTWGPIASEEFMAKDGRTWRLGCGSH
jgi:glucose-6-phosphate 1-dehydrogenase